MTTAEFSVLLAALREQTALLKEILAALQAAPVPVIVMNATHSAKAEGVRTDGPRFKL